MDASLIAMFWAAIIAGVVFFIRKYTLAEILADTFGIPWTGRTNLEKKLELAQTLRLNISDIDVKLRKADREHNKGSAKKERTKAEQDLTKLLLEHAKKMVRDVKEAVGRLPNAIGNTDATQYLKEGIVDGNRLIARAHAAIKKNDAVGAIEAVIEAQQVLEGAAIDYNVAQG